MSRTPSDLKTRAPSALPRTRRTIRWSRCASTAANRPLRRPRKNRETDRSPPWRGPQNSSITGMPTVSKSVIASSFPFTSDSETVSLTTALGSSLPPATIRKISSYRGGGRSSKPTNSSSFVTIASVGSSTVPSSSAVVSPTWTCVPRAPGFDAELRQVSAMPNASAICTAERPTPRQPAPTDDRRRRLPAVTVDRPPAASRRRPGSAQPLSRSAR